MIKELFTKYGFFILLMLGFASCDKNDFEPDYSQGKATAIKNGDDWMGQGRGSTDISENGIEMSFDVYNNEGILRQNISFVKVPIVRGQYNLFHTFSGVNDSLSGCHFATLSFDGDVVEDRYKVIETRNESTITVTDYNESERLLSGEFRLKLYIDPDRPKANSSNPDTILFEVGEFEVTIEE